jgi:hypothetical protein
MLEMIERKDEAMSNAPRKTQLSDTAQAVAAAHDGPVSAALDSVRWVRQGFLRRLKRDSVN